MKRPFKKQLFCLAAAMAATTGFAGQAYADSGWEFTSAGNSYTDGTWDFATAFSVTTTSTLTGLGYYADPVTGNVAANAVAFYQCADTACLTTGTLLASTTVTNTYPISGHFRYVTIAPITLQAGVSYEVAGVSETDNYTWSDPGFAVNSAISLLSSSGQEARWLANGTPVFLTGSPQLDRIGQDGYWGPNIFLGRPVFTGSVPEPASWALMLVGFGVVGYAMRRHARVTVAYS